ncbi:MAG: ABC transporter ATP-binding protein [Methanomicrobiaceae archaeon]|nr:ABC transporter ATP-binding protein [Methanomicrobiaceae archaeon]
MLKIENINVSYGKLQVLWDVSAHVEKGEVVTIIGSNGAGKTSLVETIFGFNTPSSGSILYEGERIQGLSPFEVVKKRIALVPERREIFPRMTVRENLVLGGYIHGEEIDDRRIYELFPVLAEREFQLAGTLSGGEQQMLAIARALMLQPKMLVLDEPSLGLAPKLVHSVLETIGRLNREGLTILLVEQNVRRALEVSDRGYVLENGRITAEGPAGTLLDDPHVQSAYLGL